MLNSLCLTGMLLLRNEGSGGGGMFWANGNLSYIFMAHRKHPHPSAPCWTTWELEFHLWAQVSFCPLQPHSSVPPRPCSGHCLPTWLWLSTLPFTSLSAIPILWAAESNTHCWCQHLYQTPFPELQMKMLQASCHHSHGQSSLSSLPCISCPGVSSLRT